MTSTIEAERNGALLDWYGATRRPLPWRDTNDPYIVLVSEVMLQQTQAQRVIPYFTHFVGKFPTVASLAVAPFSDVVALWSGLGYNTRAKRLHLAAQLIAENGWPETIEGLEQLPGVGPYTARAVAAFAFGHQVAAVDTNLRRVLSRWHGEMLNGQQLEHAATAALAAAPAAGWNQALMDLGATLCVPRNPACHECPVAPWCAGPDTYQPPRSQPRFEGSLRQVRGAVIRGLVRGPATFSELVATTGFDAPIVADALDALIADTLVHPTTDTYTIAD